MKTLQTGQWVTLDGRLGKIYPANASDGVPWMTDPLDTPAQEPEPSSAAPLNTQLFASFSQLSVLKDAQAQAIDGICLVRGEWLLLAQRSGTPNGANPWRNGPGDRPSPDLLPQH
jgi:hypothetical protein